MAPHAPPDKDTAPASSASASSPRGPTGTRNQEAAPGDVVNVVALVAALSVFGAVFIVSQAWPFDDDDDDISVSENRTLAPLPTFSWSALKTGAYTRGLDAFVADHFPLREGLLDLAAVVKSARGLAVDDVVYDTPDADTGGLEQLDTWAGDDAGTADVLVEDPDGGLMAEVLDAGPRKKPKKHKAGVSVVGDRALMFLVGDDDSAAAFAGAVNLYAETLDPSVRLYALVTPTATAFYLPLEQQDRSAAEDLNLAAMTAAYLPAIQVVDVHTALASHVDEDIFFRTDHHWTALGAWYAYAAFCDEAGLSPVALSSLEKRSKPAVLGSLYRMTQNKTLKKHADVVDYYLPSVVYTAVRYREQDLKTPQKASFVVEREQGYAVFLGGDDPMLTAITEVGNGRKALLVKNSFGNALAPFLLHHFQELVVVDYRYYAGNLARLIKSRGITDVIVQSATTTANSRAHVRRLRGALLGNGAAWEPETPEKEAERIRKYQEEHGLLPPSTPDAGTPLPTTATTTTTNPTTKAP